MRETLSGADAPAPPKGGAFLSRMEKYSFLVYEASLYRSIAQSSPFGTDFPRLGENGKAKRGSSWHRAKRDD